MYIKKNMLKINEIFYSLQGEGTRAGRLCAFVRLAGCNLRCRWCDTDYAVNTNNSEVFSVAEIIDKIKIYNCNFVEITGGEPLLQNYCIKLIDELLGLNYEVAIETNGSISLEKLNKKVIKIMDIKCPDSNMSYHNLFENLNYLDAKDEIKFVIASKTDFDWSIEIIAQHKLYEKVDNILFSAVVSDISYMELAKLILSISNKNIKNVVRMQLQYHKIIWGNIKGK